MVTKDILVIGTGISGLTFAIKVAEKNPEISLTLISKRDIYEGNTRYAQGGIAVVRNLKKDSTKKHIQDTLIAGDGACDSRVVKFVVEEANERLDELIEWGTAFDKKEEFLDLGIEGGHSEKRIVHYKDQTGKQIQEVLTTKVKNFPNITILENHTLVDLITDHHSKIKKNRCYGAYVISQEREEIIKISAKITVLSTGGAGSLYSHTTNPSISTGDGLGAAYRAKIKMDRLPYVQFHPTALRDKVDGNIFLISEAIRGAGAKLLNEKKERFMLKVDPRAELAPRDIVARGIQKEIQEQKENFVWLDGSKIKLNKWKSSFPTIYNTCNSVNIKLPQDYIPVVPAAHYFCGGIVVNEYSESSLKGLYAIGECSATGLHGANRLASNSLLEALVFANRAAIDCNRSLNNILPEESFYKKLPEWNGDGFSKNNTIENVQSLREQLQDIMTKYVGIFKTNNGLKLAEKRINEIYITVQELYNHNKLNNGLSELRNMVSVSYLLIKQAQEIKENKGVFFNYNYA
ncbi:MAG: L-aspartate oxidase [Flavobacteriaceae bacterium TMED179]|nr:MAG: L-aspartate oxidase [Flavobacteriaceae bacterium TMED179]|tara:strand:+ start:12369 stop:13925 length:1557 start_codon:yes stop_codon:yes gene_type:complete